MYAQKRRVYNQFGGVGTPSAAEISLQTIWELKKLNGEPARRNQAPRCRLPVFSLCNYKSSILIYPSVKIVWKSDVYFRRYKLLKSSPGRPAGRSYSALSLFNKKKTLLPLLAPLVINTWYPTWYTWTPVRRRVNMSLAFCTIRTHTGGNYSTNISSSTINIFPLMNWHPSN